MEIARWATGGAAGARQGAAFLWRGSFGPFLCLEEAAGDAARLGSPGSALLALPVRAMGPEGPPSPGGAKTAGATVGCNKGRPGGVPVDTEGLRGGGAGPVAGRAPTGVPQWGQ